MDQQNAEDDCCNTHLNTCTKGISCWATEHLVGAPGSWICPVMSALLIRTLQMLNEEKFVQELIEVVK